VKNKAGRLFDREEQRGAAVRTVKNKRGAAVRTVKNNAGLRQEP